MNRETIIDGGLATDDRGTLRFVNDFDFAGIKRFYQVENHRAGFVRAWHGHDKEAKYVYVAKGSAMIATVPLDDMTKGDITNIVTTVLSANKPQILCIPPGFCNGFKTLEDGTIIQFFSTKTLKESLDDDYRFDCDEDFWKERYR